MKFCAFEHNGHNAFIVKEKYFMEHLKDLKAEK